MIDALDKFTDARLTRKMFVESLKASVGGIPSYECKVQILVTLWHAETLISNDSIEIHATEDDLGKIVQTLISSGIANENYLADQIRSNATSERVL